MKTKVVINLEKTQKSFSPIIQMEDGWIVYCLTHIGIINHLGVVGMVLQSDLLKNNFLYMDSIAQS